MTEEKQIRFSGWLAAIFLCLAFVAAYWHTEENRKSEMQTVKEKVGSIVGGDPEYYAMNNENADHPVINTDAKGVIVSANRAAVDLLNVVEGDSLIDLMEVENAEKHKEIMAGDIFHNDFTVHALKEETGKIKTKDGWASVKVKGYATPAKIVVLHIWVE